ncbi:M20 family metallopeptidase [Sulfobacillus thermosulfidooxidans]|uniref:M20 family metallopeptidase n=1 Tax=Sulfobacillus thermosulfidooxidans TaxID=28034 RepID=UPI00041E0397|nr:M20/M25/M40 family metallo-hydrolase [Sulfobacillus thermosulfidooxidans]
MACLNQQIDEIVGQALPHIIEHVQSLVSIPTVNPGIDMRPAAAMLGKLAAKLGYHVKFDEVPENIAKDHGMTSARNVLATYPYQRTSSNSELILNAHFDTIAPGPGWTVPPYLGVRHKGRIYGRGIMVSKVDVIAYLFAPFLTQQIVQPTVDVTVALTGDEEMGGYVGPKRLLDNGMIKPHSIAICPGTTDQIVHEHAGVIQWRIQISGRSRHAALRERGEDANQAAANLVTQLYSYRDSLRGGGWLTVGQMMGGVATNMVSGQSAIFVDRRIHASELMENVRDELRTVIEQWTNTTDCTVTIEEIVAANPLRSQGSEPWVNWFRDKASAALQQDVPLATSPLYTDARHFAEHGIPTLCYGAGNANLKLSGAHGVDEHIFEADVEQALKVLVRVIAELWTEGPELIDKLRQNKAPF